MTAPGGLVVGIGSDLVEIPRFRLALERRPKLADRLFSDEERAYAGRFREPVPHLAARFGAKEAVMKALGVGLWKFAMRDVEVVRLASGQPRLALHGKAADLASARGVTGWELTLTHSDFMAMAVAVAVASSRAAGVDVIPLVTPAEMGAADGRTIASGTPESVLMTRAGRAVAWRVRAALGGTYGRRVAVLCGKGNNGGDGLIAADALRAWGVAVDVVRIDAPPGSGVGRALGRADLVVDAMFGTGFRGALDGFAGELADALRESSVPVVAVDIASGVDGLTGEVRGTSVRADHTVTFAAPKPGLYFHPGRACSGTVHVADIGIDLGSEPLRAAIVETSDVASWVPPRDATTHKWRSGVLVIGGSAGMTGAPMLAAHAATHLGAGIVIAVIPGDAAQRASGSEIITHTISADATGGITRAAVAELAPDLDRFGAVVLGPGLGRGDEIASTVAALARVVPGPLVLDADALVALGTDLTPVRERSASTVLTPHDGEFERLTGALPGRDRIDAARRLAAASDAVVLLKGPTSVAAAPDGRVRVNPTGTADLATAGSGDVLSGMIAAFCARGVEPLEAVAAAAFVHGRAAEWAGHTGFVATDLPALAGEALRRISES